MGCDRGEECREVHTMIDRAEPFPPPLPAGEEASGEAFSEPDVGGGPGEDKPAPDGGNDRRAGGPRSFRMSEGVRWQVSRHRQVVMTGGPEARGPFGCRRGSGGG